MITISLDEIREHGPCADGWVTLLDHLGKTKADDVRFPLTVVLDSNGLDDVLWCCKCLPQYAREWRLFAVWCARQVQHLMTDQRSVDALDVAEQYANGEATNEKLMSTRAAARAAWDDSWAAAWAAGDDSGAAAGGAAWNAWAAWGTCKPEQAEEFRRVCSETEERLAK